MKAVFFSADFVKDSNSNLRLIEINTDTGVIREGLDFFNWSELLTFLRSYSELVLVYKRDNAGNIVDHLKAAISQDSNLSSLTITEQIEDKFTIYPASVEDSATKFILRFAYDESAILDSTYAKNSVNLYKLFDDYNDIDKVCEFYYSGSGYFQDNLLHVTNSLNIPDIVEKGVVDSPLNPLTFYKVRGTGSADDNFTTFKNALKSQDTYLQNYHSVVENNKSIGYRSYLISYGTDLSIMNIGSYKTEAFLELPTSITQDANTVVNQVNRKHSYEFVTNNIKAGTDHSKMGIGAGEYVMNSSNDFVTIDSLNVGDNIQSFNIATAPDSDNYDLLWNWSHSGSLLPTGSISSSAEIVNIFNKTIPYQGICSLTLSGSGVIKVTGDSFVLTYNTGSNSIQYNVVQNLDINSDRLIDIDNKLVPILSASFDIYDDEVVATMLDIEPDDVFFMIPKVNGAPLGKPLSLKLLVHNCFVAGTKIEMADGSVKNIEEVKRGDAVLSWNEKTGEVISTTVGAIRSNTTDKLVEISDDKGTTIECTPSHMIYTKNNRWKLANHLSEGDILIDKDNQEAKITSVTLKDVEPTEVFHLFDIGLTSTYFANNRVVHNARFMPCCFAAGTKISLSDGSFKNIEDILPGDEVIGWNGSELSNGKVTKINHNSKIADHIERCKELGDEPSYYSINDLNIKCTPEHPFLTPNGWKSISPDPMQEPFLTEQQPLTLEVGDEINYNGDWIKVEEIKSIPADINETVYNFTVDGIHSYIADGIIVHNK